jgi:acetyltransferase-like isoleucine patch superfamily enzyme
MEKKTEYFVHPSAICESADVGKRTRIWAFAHILKNAKIGIDCNICDHCFIENDVKIGNRVTIKNGISVWDGITIEDDVFLGPHCVLTNDLYPRSKVHHPEYIKTLIKKGATIGANATVVCGTTLGKYCMVGAGAVVTKNVPDFALVIGNPARFKYWMSKTGEKLNFDSDNIAIDSKGIKYKLSKGTENASDLVLEL